MNQNSSVFYIFVMTFYGHNLYIFWCSATRKFSVMFFVIQVLSLRDNSTFRYTYM